MPWWVTALRTKSISLILSQDWRVMAIMMLSGKPPGIHGNVSLTSPWKHYSRHPMATQSPRTLDMAGLCTVEDRLICEGGFRLWPDLQTPQIAVQSGSHGAHWRVKWWAFSKHWVFRPRTKGNHWTKWEIAKLQVINHREFAVYFQPLKSPWSW